MKKVLKWAVRFVPMMSSAFLTVAALTASINCTGVLYQPKTPKRLS
jgi:cyclic lactone autoinducer peptide